MTRPTTGNKLREQKRNQSGHTHLIISIVVMCVLLLAFVKIYETAARHRSSPISEIESGITGYCIDDYHDSNASNAAVDTWACNGTAAQKWQVSGSSIVHDKDYCLTVQNNDSSSGDDIVSAVCDGEAGQVWVSAIDGYENPASALCLEAPDNQTDVQLVLASCDSLTKSDEAWMPATWSSTNSKRGASLTCSGTEGQLVACDAAKQWVAWQSGSVNHNTLLNNYSDGNGYEEWCADFVSYVYQQAGYPFTGGERNGWDEYNSTDVQYENFTYHAASGYTPQTGDVAFFDYGAGHVEIVAVGGTKPIFIYGDSETIDPSTGNGEMTENTITNDGSEGQVIYYLSPS
jgi:ricin-type beta-trefoil lectin protein/CHAP domain-containing protein